MPSHPDRVRLNYIDTQVRVIEEKQTDCWHMSMMISKLEIASWANSRFMIDQLFRKFAVQVHSAFGRR